MATAINKCPICGGVVNIQADISARMTIYDEGRETYEMTTPTNDIIHQIQDKMKNGYESYDCSCNDGHHLYVRRIKPGEYEISAEPFEDEKNALIEWTTKEYHGRLRIYAGYGEDISDKKVHEFLQYKYPLAKFYDYLYDRYEYGVDNSIFDIAQKAKNNGFRSIAEEDIVDIIRDTIEVRLPEDYYLDQTVKVDIYINTEDADYDFVSNAMYPHYNGRKEDYDDIGSERQAASLFWLAETQGYPEKAFFEAMQDDVEHTDSVFLRSVYEELENTPTHMPRLVFLREFTLRELLDIVENKKDIHISTDTMCGLYDTWSGGGGPLVIQLEKPLYIPHKIIFDILPAKSYDRNIDDVYGMCSWAWESRENPYKGAKIG